MVDASLTRIGLFAAIRATKCDQNHPGLELKLEGFVIRMLMISLIEYRD